MERRSANFKQLAFVKEAMSDGEWYSLRDLERKCQFAYGQSSISARLREFKNFGLVIERRIRSREGRKPLYEYRFGGAESKQRPGEDIHCRSESEQSAVTRLNARKGVGRLQQDGLTVRNATVRERLTSAEPLSTYRAIRHRSDATAPKPVTQCELFG